MKQFINMNIDENKEHIDLSDHNLLTIRFKVTTNNEERKYRKNWIVKTHMKIDKNTKRKYKEEMQKINVQEIKAIVEY